MKKFSTGSGRPSVGIPLRVRHENGSMGASTSGKTTKAGKSRSLSFSSQQNRASSIGASSYKPSHDRVSYLSKASRPSSGIGVRGRTDVTPKDPRPLMDKKFQHECISKLHEFLKINSYPHPTSQKLLTSPTSKDFFKIFVFIYSKCSSDDYKGIAKMEEEVPRVLRMVGYPFTFSKQYLYSVGSPHSWPHLLGALIWLIDLIQMSKDIPDVTSHIFGAASSEDFDKKPDDRIAFEYYQETFIHFMEGNDTFEDLDDQLRLVLRQNLQGENIDSLKEKNQRYEAELERFGAEEDVIEKKKDEIGAVQQDIKDMHRYLEEAAEFKRGISKHVAEREEACRLLNSDLESEKDRLDELHQILQKQDFSQADVERFKAEQTSLRQKVNQLEKQVEDIDSENWKISMEMAKINEKVEKEVAAYNRMAIQLKIVPETADFASGRDFRLRAGSNQDIVSQFENNIKVHLKKIKSQCTQENLKLKKEHFQLKCKLEKLEENSSEKREKIVQKQKELDRLEAEINTMKQVSVSDKKSVSSEVESLQDSLRQCRIEKAVLEAAKVEAAAELRGATVTCQTEMEAVAKELTEIEHAQIELPKILKAQTIFYKEQAASMKDRLRQILAQERKRLEQVKAEAVEREKRVDEILNDPIEELLDF